jgi:hypothetical protein
MHPRQIYGAQKGSKSSDTPMKRPLEWPGLAVSGLIGKPSSFFVQDRPVLLATLL